MARRSRLIWTEPALQDLDDIAAWIAVESRVAAAKVVRRTVRAIERLRQFPESGRRVPEAPGTRYREVIVPPCRVIYRREGSSILLVHVLRSERILRMDALERESPASPRRPGRKRRK